MSITMKTILALLIAGVIGGGVLYSNHAQSQVRTDGQSADQRYAVSVPIKFMDAQMRDVPGSFMRGLAENISKDIGDDAMEVVDVSFAVSAKSAEALAPSLQPRLFIGDRVYNGQRMEIENWDPRKEQAVDESKPVGETLYFHFFLPLEHVMEMEDVEMAFLTTLEKAELMGRTDGKIDRRTLRRIDRNLSRHMIKLETKALMEAK